MGIEKAKANIMKMEVLSEPQMISCNVGQYYKVFDRVYILSGFEMNGNHYAVLISTIDGNRLVEPVEVKDFNKINPAEFKLITSGQKYELVKK